MSKDSHDFSDAADSLIQRALRNGVISECEAQRLMHAYSDDSEVSEQLHLSGIDVVKLLRPSDDRGGGEVDDRHANSVKYRAADCSEDETDTSQHADTDSRQSAAATDPSLAGLPPRYEVRDTVGTGGMGRVYLAFDRELKREVAVKIVTAERFRSRFGDMMRREREILAMLHRPGIVSVFDSGELDDGSPFFVMQLVRGKTLKHFANDSKLDLRGRVTVVLQIAESLAGVHPFHVIHRDLKPDNIRVDEDGQPMILDFGLSKIADIEFTDMPEQTVELSYQTTASGQIAGTPSYMSPEQAAGEAVGPTTDIYSLGVILYELLAGCVPLDISGERKSRLAELLRECVPERLDRVARNVPRDLAAIVHKCLAKTPPERYADAAELAGDLRRYLDHQPVATYAAGRPVYRAAKFVRRYPVSSLVALLAVLFLSATAVSSLFYLRSERRRRVSDEQRHAVEMQRQAAESARAEAELEQQATEKLRIAEETANRRYRELRDTDQQRMATQDTRRYLDNGEFTLAIDALQPFIGTSPPGKLRHRRGWEHDRMALEAGIDSHEIKVVGGHEWEVLCTLASPDRKSMVTSGLDGRVIAWDMASGKQRVLQNGIWHPQHLVWRTAAKPFGKEPAAKELPDAFFRLAWLDGGRQLVGVSLNGRVRVWDFATGESRTAAEHASPLVAVDAMSDGDVLVADDAGLLFRLDKDELQPVQPARYAAAPVTDIAQIADRCWLIGQADGELSVLNKVGDRITHTITQAAPLWDIAVDARTRQVAVVCGEPRAKIFTFDDRHEQLVLSRVYEMPAFSGQQPRALHAVCLDVASQRLLAGDEASRLIVWSLTDGRRKSVTQFRDISRSARETLESLPLAGQRKIAGIECGDAESTFVAGRDTLVRRLTSKSPNDITTLNLRPRAKIEFDRSRADVLWEAAENSLRLVDTRTGTPISEPVSHEGNIIDLDIARDDGLVATCTHETIHFWRINGDQVVAAHPSIRCQTPPRSISVRHDGRRLAISDTSDVVTLWNVATGEPVGSCSLRSEDDTAATLSGMVDFNADGSRIGALGPGAAVFVLSGHDAVRIDEPYVAAGAGVAIAWHPSDPEIFLVIDSQGDVRVQPPETNPCGLRRARNDRGIDISFNDDGSRFVSILHSGKFVLHDPQWVGETGIWQSGHVNDTGARPTACRFDPEGKRLAIVHGDGVVKIWETQPSFEFVIPRRTRSQGWRAEHLTLPDPAPHWFLRPPAVQLDAQDRVNAAYLRSDNPRDAAVDVSVKFGRQEDGRFAVRTVERLPAVPQNIFYEMQKTVALAANDVEVVGVFRRPRADLKYLFGEQVLFRPEISGGSKLEVITDTPANIGFWSNMFFDNNGQLTITHFTYSGYYLLATRRTSTGWTSQRLGARGDGRSRIAAIGPTGRLHAADRSFRFPRDIGFLTYSNALPDDGDFNPTTSGGQHWEPLSLSGHVAGLAVDVKGNPAILVAARSAGASQWMLARRIGNQWRETILLRDTAGPATSNLVSNGEDRFQFAYYQRDGDDLRVALVTIDGGICTEQTVHRAENLFANGYQLLGSCLTVRYDRAGHPVIILFHHSDVAGRLDIFRHVNSTHD